LGGMGGGSYQTHVKKLSRFVFYDRSLYTYIYIYIYIYIERERERERKKTAKLNSLEVRVAGNLLRFHTDVVRLAARCAAGQAAGRVAVRASRWPALLHSIYYAELMHRYSGGIRLTMLLFISMNSVGYILYCPSLRSWKGRNTFLEMPGFCILHVQGWAI